MNRLGLRIPLIDREMPSSLVSRLARLHGTNPRDFCSDMGLQWPHICSAHPEQLSRLAKLADVSLFRLLRWSGPLVSPCRYRVGYEIASTGVFRRAVTRICPRCVVEGQAKGLHAGPFQRVEWLVQSIHVCSDHHTALLKLPNARHAHDTYDLLTQIERHQGIIQRAADSDGSTFPTGFEDYVLSRIQGRAATSWLTPLELQHMHRGCLTLGAALLFGSSKNSTALDVVQSRAALDRGYSVLRSGPAQLLAALTELKKAYQTERPYFSTDMGDFYTWLKEEVEEPKLQEMRHAVRNFITENYPLRSGMKILGEEISMGRRMTFSDARQVSGIARARMATTLGHLRPASRNTAGTVTDVSVEDIQTVDAFWRNHSNLKDAAERLGLHPAQIKAFIEVGVLEAVRLSSALRYVTNASIDAVLVMVSNAPVDHPNSELLPIAEFSQSRCISMARVVCAALDGKIIDVRRNPDLSGIRSLLIDNGQLPIRQRRRHKMDMSVTEAAEHLQIGAMGVRALRDSGYLVQVHRRNPDTNHQRAFITVESISRFEVECETLGQLATRMGVRSMHLAKWLDNAGIDPVATKGRMVRVYRRAELPGYLGCTSPHAEKDYAHAT
ncbi:TniQ family protein [Rhodobacter sp. 24-YEA-8]|uniref:TniQ family protein n=1 Tax=Rhodobacter sp. 24-YEA-8 TaxID=1884310 RepID=UPI000895ABDB|nr:TniQ family protein [Rhodobacter sp. 24-YEA-8]SEB47678.1 TniQ protein [Rhodobacter sp. 24-YEA-8]